MSSDGDSSQPYANRENYDRQIILESITNPNYAKERQEEIEDLEKLIAEDFNVEEVERVLKKLKATPPGPVLDPSEPRGLTEAVYCRIECLKLMLPLEDLRDNERTNILGVLKAYREGKLQVEPNKVSYWKGGVMKRGLGEPLKGEDLRYYVDMWNKEEPAGNVWTEDTGLYGQMAATAIFPPFNTFQQHRYDVEVRLVGGVSTVTFTVMDDTGATYLTMKAPDLSRIGYNSNYASTRATIQTANGLVQWMQLQVEIQLFDQTGASIGEFVETPAVVDPVIGGGGDRLSGMFVRRSLFTGTSPDGSGNLIVSTKKSGMVRNVTAV